MDEEPISKKQVAVVREALRTLMVHFDTVQIFCTYHVEDGEDSRTASYQNGKGNWFARYGQIREWITKEEEAQREDVRIDEEEEP